MSVHQAFEIGVSSSARSDAARQTSGSGWWRATSTVAAFRYRRQRMASV